MQLITHQSHLDALPASDMKTHIQHRFNQLSEDTDVPPNIVLAESDDDIAGSAFGFVGNRGLVSDLFESARPRGVNFVRPFEWISYLPELQLYEALLLKNNEDGYWILIPETIVEAHPDLKWVLTNESQGGLSRPQSL